MTDKFGCELKQHVQWAYERLLKSPQMLMVGDLAVAEAYILALESLLDQFEGPGRCGRYLDFIDPAQFPSESFTTSLLRRYSCNLGLIRTDNLAACEESEELKVVFTREFERHWKSFMDFRNACL